MKPLFAIVMALLLLAPAALADDVSGRLGLGMEFGTQKMWGGDEDYNDIHHNLGAHLRYGLKPNWTLELGYKGGWSHPWVNYREHEAGFNFPSSKDIYNVFHQPRIGLLYHFSPDKQFEPYLGVAAGAIYNYTLDRRGDRGEMEGPFVAGPQMYGYDEDGERVKLRKWDFSATFTLGADYFVHPDFAFNAGLRYHIFPGNNVDNVGLSALWGPYHVDANDQMFEGYVGFTWFWGQKDRDGDGILDKDDACPDNPEDFDDFQDEDGCPDLDNDGDGIFDAKDQCPNIPEDLDGFEDEDGCPDPDNDGDGILDRDDQCPNRPEDFDGFEDEDGCPDPDNDGDGILDPQDECPGTPKGVAVDLKGCPKAEQLGAVLVLDGVNFDTDSYKLTPIAKIILDKVAGSLKAWPQVRVRVEGHTDSTFTEAYNQTLSVNRANAVKDYLVGKGIDPGRIVAKGFGESKPVATNDTAEGRAQNRRVEIHKID